MDTTQWKWSFLEWEVWMPNNGKFMGGISTNLSTQEALSVMEGGNFESPRMKNRELRNPKLGIYNENGLKLFEVFGSKTG